MFMLRQLTNTNNSLLLLLVLVFVDIKNTRLCKFLYSPTDAQLNCLKNNFKIYVKIDIKTAPTCFSSVTPSTGSALLVLAKVKVVKIAN
jgi:hypothetical protein